MIRPGPTFPLIVLDKFATQAMVSYVNTPETIVWTHFCRQLFHGWLDRDQQPGYAKV